MATVGVAALAFDAATGFEGVRGFISSIGRVGSLDATFTEAVGVGFGVGGGLAGLAEANAARLGAAATAGLASLADDFFVGTRFSPKVQQQMSQGDFHSFPRSVEGFQASGSVSKVVGGDGVPRQLLEIPGGFRGREGTFQFMKDASGTINHRFFRPN